MKTFKLPWLYVFTFQFNLSLQNLPANPFQAGHQKFFWSLSICPSFVPGDAAKDYNYDEAVQKKPFIFPEYAAFMLNTDQNLPLLPSGYLHHLIFA